MMQCSLPSSKRRIVALVLPEILCELAEQSLRVARAHRASTLTSRRNSAGEAPFGVVLAEEGKAQSPALHTRVQAVNAAAKRLGMRAGHSLAEALALDSAFRTLTLPRTELRQRLGSIAEIAAAFGSPVAFEEPHTVWADVTGAAHLWGGEAELTQELASRVRGLGHHVRVAIADGKELARAFAYYLPPSPRALESWVVPTERTVSAFAELPLAALGLDEATLIYLGQLGLIHIRDLGALPRASLAARLGAQAARILELCAGHDPEPLVPYTPPGKLYENAEWDEPISTMEPLRFILGKLVAQLAARLEGRAQAFSRLCMTLKYDTRLAQFRGIPNEQKIKWNLASPLFKKEDVLRIIQVRLDKLELQAPCTGLALEASELGEAPRKQLAFTADQRAQAQVALPALIAELSEDIGASRVGVLRNLDAHRPELRSGLFAPALGGPGKFSLRKAKPQRLEQRRAGSSKLSPLLAPTRLLPKPTEIPTPFEIGATFAVGQELFTLEELRLAQRLEAVEWWTPSAIQRDYLWLKLRNPGGTLEVLAYIDRNNRKRYLHGVWD